MAQADTTTTLFEAAREAAQKAHAPYSKFLVGAALLAGDGKIHAGCNIENQSYPEGWCAETSAIAHMVMKGGDTAIAEVAVYSPNMAVITPCGGCRQRLAEFGTSKTRIHLCNDDGVVETVTLADLLPKAFELGQEK